MYGKLQQHQLLSHYYITALSPLHTAAAHLLTHPHTLTHLHTLTHPPRHAHTHSHMHTFHFLLLR